MSRPPDEPVRTVAAASRTEIEKIKGSRFICDLAPAEHAAAALEFVDHVREIEPRASHHCWAYRLGSGATRSSDDGEPAGTAGAPILRRLEGADLADVVAVVTRHYGGTNLGTGGLMRAYGAAAAAAIETADVVSRRRTAEFRLKHPYELSAAVNRVLAANEAEINHAGYEASVNLEISVPLFRADTFVTDLREATAGGVTAVRVTPS